MVAELRATIRCAGRYNRRMVFASLDLTADPAWPWSLPRLACRCSSSSPSASRPHALDLPRRHRKPRRSRRCRPCASRPCCSLCSRSCGRRSPSAIPAASVHAAPRARRLREHDRQGRGRQQISLGHAAAHVAPLPGDASTGSATSTTSPSSSTASPRKWPTTTPTARPTAAATDFGRLLHALASGTPRSRTCAACSSSATGPTTARSTRPRRGGPLACARAARCQAFALGQASPVEPPRRRLTTLTPEPSPVPVKGKLTVRATLDAPGFENREVNCTLFLDDKEVKVQPPGCRRPRATRSR